MIGLTGIFIWINFLGSIPVRTAVGATDTESIELTLPCGYRLDGTDTATKQRMPMVKLDTVVCKMDRIDFIKSDTDGYEAGVFEGARATLQKHRPVLLFEVAPFYSSDCRSGLEQLFSDLAKLGYGFESLSGCIVDPMIEMATVKYPESIEMVARPL